MNFGRFHLLAVYAALLLPLEMMDAAAQGAAADSSSSQTAPSDATKFSPEKPADRRINFPDLPDKGGLFGGSESFSTPSPPPVPMTRQRSQAELDEKNNWAFMTADDVVRNLSGLGAGKAPDFGPDGRDRNTYSAVERFFDRMSRGNGNTGSTFDPSDLAPLNPAQSDWTGSRVPGFGNNSLSLTPGGAMPGLQNLTPGYGSLANPLNIPSYGVTPDFQRQRESHQKHIESFKQLLAPPATVVTVAPAQPESAGFGTGIPRSTFPGGAGADNPYGLSTLPTSLQAPTAPGQPGYSTPATSPARTPSRPSTDFSIPKRSF